MTPSRSGTSGNPITFLAAFGPRPRVRGFTLRDRNHISVEGFEITNQAMSSDRNASFEIGGSVALRIINNTRNNSRRGGTTNNVNGSNHVSVLNNIYVDAVAVNARSKTMHRFGSTGTDESNYNLAYMTSGSVTWADPINSEPNSIHNQNPRFVSNADFNLQSGSPALDAGGSLTRISAEDSGSGTMLRVTDTHFFQDGWAGVSPDWIAVGTTNHAAQIASIDYASNIITLAAAISRSPNDPVWLYRDSNGRQVLYGSAPDIGAYEYGSGSPPSSDTTPRVISNASASSISQTSASITWNTEENADSQIDYGTSASYGSQTIHNASLVTSHSQTVSGLSAGALYYYRVRSRDAAGNLSISGDHTFTTQTSGAAGDARGQKSTVF